MSAIVCAAAVFGCAFGCGQQLTSGHFGRSLAIISFVVVEEMLSLSLSKQIMQCNRVESPFVCAYIMRLAICANKMERERERRGYIPLCSVEKLYCE